MANLKNAAPAACRIFAVRFLFLMSGCAALGVGGAPLHAADIAQKIENIQRGISRGTPAVALNRERGVYSLDGSAAEPPWYFKVAMISTYNSNIAYAPSGEVDAGKFAPFGELGYEHQFSAVKVSSTFNLGAERYTTATTNNIGWLSGKLAAQLSSDENDLWVTPFVFYQPFFLRSAGFGSHIAATHDFSLGAKKAFCFEHEPGSCDAGTATTLEFVAAGRIRVSDPKDANDKRLALEINFDHSITGAVGLGIYQTLSASWFESGANNGRHDWMSSTVLALSYVLGSKAMVILGANFTHNGSSVAANRYDQWDVGPTVQMKWKF